MHEGAVVPEARTGPVARRIEELAVREVLTSPSGATLLDFGQNVVGRLRITVSGEAGQEIVLRHAEVLELGELGTRPLRFADATDRYVLAGDDVEVWEPAFTFHGFRYVQVDGWPGELDPADIVAVVVHSDMERTGLVPQLRPAPRPLPRERRVGDEGELPLPADGLPAARRAARLDGRHPGVRPDRELPVRRRRPPRLLAA